MNYLIFLSFFIFPLFGFSEIVEFSTEDLPFESVVAKFEDPVMVKKRNINLTKRVQLEMGGSFFPKEAFFQCCLTPSLYGSMGFYLDETHGAFLKGIYYTPGLGKYGRALDKKEFKGSVSLDPKNIPQPIYEISLSYEPMIYYGKISLSKNMVMNLSLFGIFAAGVSSDATSSYLYQFSFGLGKKLYFNKHFGLRLGIEALSKQGLSFKNLGSLDEDQSFKDYKAKGASRWYLFQQIALSLGVVILI